MNVKIIIQKKALSVEIRANFHTESTTFFTPVYKKERKLNEEKKERGKRVRTMLH